MPRELSELSILVLTGDRAIVNFTCKALGRLEVRVAQPAHTGPEALELLKKHNFDVCIVPLELPKMDSHAFLAALSELDLPPSLILFEGDDPKVLHTTEQVVEAHGLSLLGALVVPVNTENLATLFKGLQERKEKPQPGQQEGPIKLSPREITEGLEKGYLIPFYQPKVEIPSGRLVGVECLARWQDPERGLISPDAFIPVAEKHGLIGALTRSMLTQALEQAAEWQLDGLDLKVSVNVSMDDLGEDDFPHFVIETAQAAGISLDHVILEVTETKIMKDIKRPLATLSRLRMKGIGIAIDDYGTGFSSLKQISQVPATELKVDREFVFGASKDADKRAILESSLDLGRKLDLITVAEGAETLEDWRLLEELGCDLCQGYFVARPMAATEIASWRKTWQQEKPAPVPMAKEVAETRPDVSPPVGSSSHLAGILGLVLLVAGAGATYYFWPALMDFGSRTVPEAGTPAPLIEEAQGLFNRLGYEVGPPSGKVTPRTKVAIRSFERDQGLLEVGVIDALVIEKLKAELTRRDKAAWQAAITAGTEEAFEGYRTAWPAGRRVADVDDVITRLKAEADEAAWQKAGLTNTIPAFVAYGAAWPKGPHAGEAETEIARIRTEQADQRAWAAAKRKSTIEGYEAYGRAWPRGTHAGQAETEIARIRTKQADQRAWAAAIRKGTIEGYEAYGAAWPKGAHLGEAATEIARIRTKQADQRAWAAAIRKGTIEGYEAYAKAWPGGTHIGDAKTELAGIRAEQAAAARRKAEQEEEVRRRAAREEQAWVEADKQDTTAGYNRFMKAFPGSKHLVEAQTNIGLIYERGRGVPRNDVEAVKWFRLAASQGGAEAQYKLGVMYQLGQGVPSNDAEALNWFGLAAAQGRADAHYMLGVKYESGAGVPKDQVEALKWIITADALGYPNASYHVDLLKRLMGQEQIAEAERRAAEWLKDNTEQ